jgi:hypothetical protein
MSDGIKTIFIDLNDGVMSSAAMLKRSKKY